VRKKFLFKWEVPSLLISPPTLWFPFFSLFNTRAHIQIAQQTPKNWWWRFSPGLLGLNFAQTVLIGATFCLYTTINRTISLDCGGSYHGSNSSPSLAMASILVTTFCADGLHRSVPRSYVSKLTVLVLKNLAKSISLFGLNFGTYCTDRCNILPLVTTESNPVLGLQWKLPLSAIVGTTRWWDDAQDWMIWPPLNLSTARSYAWCLRWGMVLQEKFATHFTATLEQVMVHDGQ
jgi:hypothetical protein